MDLRLAVAVPAAFFAALALALLAPACDNTGGYPDYGDGSPTPATDGPVNTGDGAATAPCVPDESAKAPADRCDSDAGSGLPACNTWLKVELPGTVCGDGSQYKFFVNWTKDSNDLLVSFEPGGACWDYGSCTGAGGTRGAANPHGIPDDHMASYQYLNLHRRSDDNPAQHYNMVFVPYCTGDIHTGNNVITYTAAPTDGGTDDASASDGGAGDAGPDSITFHHAGHANTMAVIDWLKAHFASVPKMFVTGCSAGGAGGIINYHFIRKGMGSQVQCGYLLDDSGPIFHSNGPSKQLHEKIRASWNVDPITDQLQPMGSMGPTDIKADFGLLNTYLAKEFPKDRLSLVLYQMDLNYSLYSYQRFFPGSTEADIHKKWMQDITAIIPTYDAEKNMAYYFPFFRQDNCSHCVSIPPIGDPPAIPTDQNLALGMPWQGSEIKEDMNIDLKAFTTTLLDDTKPLKSYIEKAQNGAFTPAVSLQCLGN